MRRGLCCGSFDPITVGHEDMIRRSAKLCDHLTVAVLRNLAKTSYFTAEQRLEMVKSALKDVDNVDFIFFDGHLTTYVLEQGYDVVFRGLRSSADFDYEIVLAQLYDKFYNGRCETVYLMTKPELSYISSSIVRENFSFGADVSGWVSDDVLKLMKKYKGEKK